MENTVILMNKICVDLCSGLGGFSQAFLDAGWETIRIDNDLKFSEVPYTFIADVRKLSAKDLEEMTSLKDFKKYDLIIMVMSPPCTYFSRAAHCFPRNGIRESLEIVGACLELVVAIQPKFWGLENPDNGYLKMFIGIPQTRLRLIQFGYSTIKPTAIWGNIPFPLLRDAPRKNRKRNAFANGVRDPSKRALLPIAFSKTVLEACI
jgi:site-specific DNA-cytosine methylase